MSRYTYTLDPTPKKYNCPSCRKKRFVRYVDTTTRELLPEQYGKCDRSDNCGYHLNPYSDGYGKKERNWQYGSSRQQASRKERKVVAPAPVAPVISFDVEAFQKTLGSYEKNVFLNNLSVIPDIVDILSRVTGLYALGTIPEGDYQGATTFPFIDVKGSVRAVQVKTFDRNNHTTGTNFLHAIIKKEYERKREPLPDWLTAYIAQDKRVTCLFGEHLLARYPNRPVNLVEAPKTAIYGTLYFGHPDDHPDNPVWLAVYNKSSFTLDRIKVLGGRTVSVFPDLSKDGNTFKEWESKAKEFERQLPGTRFVMSDLLEKLASPEQRESGADLADILIKLDWRQFRQGEPNEREPDQHPNSQPGQPEPDHNDIWQELNTFFETTELPALPARLHDWSDDIAELERFFATATIPAEPVQLNPWTRIANPQTFVKAHLEAVTNNNGNKTYLPYLNRLKALHEIIKC